MALGVLTWDDVSETVAGSLAPADTMVLATVWTPDGTRTCPARVVTPTTLDLRFATRVSAGVAAPECGDEPLAWDSMAVPVALLAYDENFSAWATPSLTSAVCTLF